MDNVIANFSETVSYYGNWYGIRLDGTECTVRGNILASNYMGMYSYEYDADLNNIIYGNVITDSDFGIYCYHYQGNGNNIAIAYENNIANNKYGLYCYKSINNKFYHNNLIDNTYHTYFYNSRNMWDDDYPSGGNYWSDYYGIDRFMGPGQNVSGSDGIGDAPYVADGQNQDNYPLMNPYVPSNLTVSIYTDKYTYHAGNLMRLGLNVANPDSVKYLCFAAGVELPDSSIHLYMHEHSVLLPIGLNYVNPTFESITLPSLPPGTYKWHVAFLERATHTIIVEDTAEWEFS